MANLDELRQYLPQELTKAKERGKYVCPLCGSGTGPKSTAAFSIDKDGVHGHCFSCGFYGDIFDLYAQRDGLTLQDATRAVTDRYGSPSARPAPVQRKAAVEDQPAPTRDFRADITRFHAAIPGSAGETYLNGRGITAESIERFSLGYDAQRRQVIIPYNRRGSYYGMRSVDPNATRKHDKPAGVKAPLFNAAALYGEDPCFVVESPLCAISIMQEGGAAVALGGVNLHLLQAEIEQKKPTAPLLLSLDNDAPHEDGRQPGQEAAAKLAAWLDDQGITWAYANVAGECKDPNEALQKEPDAFRQRISEAVEACRNQAEEAENQRREQYFSEAASGFVDAFIDGVVESASTPPTPTGFYGLDKLLEGGLYEGLYTIGAISSLGKTSFVLQMCDQIAAAGRDILFFSLEMGRYELMAKSISRMTRQLTIEQGLPQAVAKTTRGILTGKRYEQYSPQEKQIIAQAVERYRETVSGHTWIIEGVGNIGTAEIRIRAEQHIALTGRKPVIVVDYLQILAPVDVRASDKQNTDRNVLELKRLSRDLKIPVIGISSLNRDNYTEPINMAAFKESGAIEYGSDCLIGLQYQGMAYEKGETEKARTQRIRDLFESNNERARAGGGLDIEVKLLKNRNGGRGTSDPILFHPMFNLFQEHPAGMTPVAEADNPYTEPKKEQRY